MGVKGLVIFSLLLLILFAKPLYELTRYALKSDLHSHALLVPFITAYLIWLKGRGKRGVRRAECAMRNESSGEECGASRSSAMRLPGKFDLLWPSLLGGAGLAILALHWFALAQGWQPERNDRLAILVFSFLCLLVGGVAFFMGVTYVRKYSFPLAFLIFMVPMPTVMVNGLEMFFQYTSAEAASLFMHASSTPVLRNGLSFQLPGITIRVAEECSGIRSSWVLFITSLLAGHLFLRSPWKKWFLALAVIPLGIIRNGFRIFTIAMLCVHVSTDMIHSPIHHRGGPIFFVLSLVPFFLLLWWLRRSERKAATLAVPESTQTPHPEGPLTR